MKKLGNFESVDDTSDADENNENDIENEDNMEDEGDMDSEDDVEAEDDMDSEDDVEAEDNMDNEDDVEDEADMETEDNLEDRDNIEGDTEKKQESDDGGRETDKMSPFEKIGKAIKSVLGKKEGAENSEKTDAGTEKTPEDAKNEMDQKKEDFLNSLKVDSNGNYVYRKNESGGNAEDSIQAHGDNGERTRDSEKTYDDDER